MFNRRNYLFRITNVSVNTTLVDPFAINVARCTIKNSGDKGNSSLLINGVGNLHTNDKKKN